MAYNLHTIEQTQSQGQCRVDGVGARNSISTQVLSHMQRRKPRGLDARRDRAILFLVKLGDNGVLWNVLSFWRATD